MSYLIVTRVTYYQIRTRISWAIGSICSPAQPGICGFLSFSKLMEKVNGIRQLGIAASLNPQFPESTAQYFDPSAGD